MNRFFVLVSIFILSAVKAFANKTNDTIHVYFDLAIHELNETAMTELDSLAYYNILPVDEKYGIIGYADYLGSEESNIDLSQKRAETVQQYLQGLGIKPANITTVTGKGEVNRESETTDGYPTDRRVDIIIGGFKPVMALHKTDSVSKKCLCGKDHNVHPIKRDKKPNKENDIANVNKNETIRLENIFFLPGSHKIREQSSEPLFQLYITMKDNPNLKINIEGHICCLTNTTEDGYDYDAKEYGLSKNRAKAVYEYLIERGIDETRMSYKGFGISRPLIWPERSLADENMNRRVEIRILDK